MRPKIIKCPDLDILKKACEEYMDYIHSPKYHSDNDYPHFIFEDCMKTMYGEDIFKYLNKLEKEK